MLPSLNLSTALVMAGAGTLTWLLTRSARRIAPAIGLVDRPDAQRKRHARPTPLLGGVAIYAALVAVITLAWLCGALPVDTRWETLLPLLTSAGLFCLVGAFDDWRPQRPLKKLCLQTVAALPFVCSQAAIESVSLLGWQIELQSCGTLLTLFWIVGCANAVNLIDGLDGLAATFALIASAAIAVHADMIGATGAAFVALVFAGALVGFLPHNCPPAKIFLGDSGSLTLGLLIGALSLEASIKRATGFALAVPLVLVSVPVFDTIMAIVRRKLNGRGIGEGDRGHIHHCLLDRGLTRWQSLTALATLCTAMAIVTLVSAYFQNDWLALGLCGALLAALVVGRVFGYDEALLIYRHAHALTVLIGDLWGVLCTRMLLARMEQFPARDPLIYWEQLIAAFARMKGTRLEFRAIDADRAAARDELLPSLIWQSPDPLPPGAPTWSFDYAVEPVPGLTCAIRATGFAQDGFRAQRTVDLFRLCDAFCRKWGTQFVAHEKNPRTPSVGFASEETRASSRKRVNATRPSRTLPTPISRS